MFTLKITMWFGSVVSIKILGSNSITTRVFTSKFAFFFSVRKKWHSKKRYSDDFWVLTCFYFLLCYTVDENFEFIFFCFQRWRKFHIQKRNLSLFFWIIHDVPRSFTIDDPIIYSKRLASFVFFEANRSIKKTFRFKLDFDENLSQVSRCYSLVHIHALLTMRSGIVVKI